MSKAGCLMSAPSKQIISNLKIMTLTSCRLCLTVQRRKRFTVWDYNTLTPISKAKWCIWSHLKGESAEACNRLLRFSIPLRTTKEEALSQLTVRLTPSLLQRDVDWSGQTTQRSAVSTSPWVSLTSRRRCGIQTTWTCNWWQEKR